jgi:hypothetical protein
MKKFFRRMVLIGGAIAGTMAARFFIPMIRRRMMRPTLKRIFWNGTKSTLGAMSKMTKRMVKRRGW